jgi:hypothetical protein
MGLSAPVVYRVIDLAEFVDQWSAGCDANKLDRIESALDGRIPEHRKESGTLPPAGAWLNPGVALSCARMIRDREDFDIARPNGPAKKSFTNIDGFQMLGGTTVKLFDDAFKRRDVSLVRCAVVRH